MKFRKNEGILFWITGLSGSGKTTLANKIHNFVENKYGPTIIVSGDDLRKLLKFTKFDRKSRLNYALNYSNICKKIVSQNINVIFATVSLFHEVRLLNKKNINNYIEIYIKSNIDKLFERKEKFFYKKKI